MTLLKDIKGQNNAVRYLANSLSSGRVASSYLFIGTDGVGRALTAKAFLKELICGRKRDVKEACGICPSCQRVDTLDHPDITWIKPEKNKKIKIEEVRKAREVLNMKPFESSVNACVIEDAHMMTVEASNALLKVLEEPPGESILILISSKRDMLLPTIISRCSEVRFNSLPVDMTKNIIMQNSEVSEKDASFLASFSEGSPGRALEMIEEEVIERKNGLLEMLKEIAEEENVSCLNWDVDKKDQLIEDVELLIMFFRDIAVSKEGMKGLVLDKDIFDAGLYDYFGGYDIDKIRNIVEKLVDVKRALLGNINPKLVAQVLPAQLK